ncbi:hypothetical protein [Gulosibacter molinativorax]|uniref:ABC transporter permease n=1 Tax=Gulosibacter molinativorax TaxID=256821 RepID=A0ABT7C5Z7_9MICO|nr:hypothetical protein [Gulosibacter molinativorax]MDJ1370626.1 hypothetical protein [Gulosibacter molinativorax]QUY61960.1 Hypotetical protein [Gulosibacter molinativorax]
MAGHLVSLSWRSVAQSFTPRGQVRGSAWFGVYAIAFGLLVVAITTQLASGSADAGGQLIRGALVTAIGIGCFAVGAITHAADPLDERAVVFAGKSPTAAALGTLFSSFLTPAPLALLGLAALVVLLAMPGSAPWEMVVAALLIALTWVLLARLGVRSGRGLSGRRWGREVGRLAGYLVLLVAAPLTYAVLFLPWREAVEVGGDAATKAMEWFPPASMLLLGNGGGSVLPILGTVGLILALLILELGLGRYSARRAMRDVTPGGSTRLGLFKNSAGNATRAVGTRIGLAWLRDGRYGVLLSTVILLPVLMVIPIALGGLSLTWLTVLPLPIFAFLLGWAMHNDTAYDSTALWLHVTSGMRGIVDRFGRALPTLTLGIIVVLLGGLVTMWFADSGIAGVATAGVALGLLGAAVGGSAIMSAWRPYPVARPGDSPFSQPIRSWGDALVMHPLAGVIEIALCSHVIWLAIVAIRDAHWGFAWATLSIGVATGLLLCLIGMQIGGRVFGKRSWKLLEFAQSY